MTLPTMHTDTPVQRDALRRSTRSHQAHLLALGTALPKLVFTQLHIERTFAAIWNLNGEALDRWQRICRSAGIERRCGVMPLDEIIALTTAQRMERYEAFAPELAERAARRAIENAGITPNRITDLIVVSCTGFAAPGLDVALIKQLNLPATTRRTMIGYMGCFGAINGLRTAAALCRSDPNAVALVVCCELCTLHARVDAGMDNQIASALFGDGAAAAVVAGDRHVHHASGPVRHDRPGGGLIGQVTLGHSRLIPETEQMMSWRVTDAGFAMTLARAVPAVLRRALSDFIHEACDEPPRAIVPHPGGPGVLDAVEAAIPDELTSGVAAGRQILHECGNVSSAAVLFVLQRMIQDEAELPAMLLAFGPGLTVESIRIQPA